MTENRFVVRRGLRRRALIDSPHRLLSSPGALLALAACLVACGRPAPPRPPASPIERDLAAGQSRAFVFRLPAARYLSLAYRQIGLEIEGELAGPDGRRIAEAGRAERLTLKRLAVVTGKAGEYRLTLRGRDAPGVRGRFRLEVDELHVAGDDDERRAAARRAFSEGLRRWDAGDVPEGRRRLEEARRLFHAAGDDRGEVDAENEIGNVLLNQLDPQAYQRFDRALTLARRAGYDAGEAKALSYTMVADLFFGRPGAAVPQRVASILEAGGRALGLWKGLGDVAEEGEVASNLGFLYSGASTSFPSDLDQAAAWFQRALGLRRQAGDVGGEANTLNGLAGVSQALSQYAAAEKLFLEARELSRRLADRRVEEQIVANLATLYHVKGDLQKALDTYDDPLLTGLPAASPTGASRLVNIAALYVELGEPDRALDAYGRVLAAASGANANLQLHARINVAQILFQQGKAAAAVDQLSRALAESRRLGLQDTEALALDSLSSHYLKSQPRIALQILEPAREQLRKGPDRSFEAEVLLKIASAHRQLGDRARADRELGEALGLARLGKRPSTIQSCLRVRAAFDLERGDPAAARSEIEEAIASIEAERGQMASDDLRIAFLSRQRSLYDLDVHVLMELDRRSPGQGFDRAAFLASEHGHARGLLDLIAESQLGLRTAGAAPLGAPEIERLLDGETALLEYWLGEKTSYLFVVTRGGLATYRLTRPAAAVEQQVAEVRRAVESPGGARLASYRRGAARLCRDLLPPGAAARRNLLIVPDEALHLLPFEILLTAEPDGATPLARLPYLLAAHAVSYAPSASVLGSLRERAPAGGRRLGLLAYGYPGPPMAADRPAARPAALQAASTLAASDAAEAPARAALLAPLVRVDGEVAAIAALYPPSERKLYLDAQASRQNVVGNPLLAVARRIYFASHGLIDEEHPELSSLVLAPGPGDDGRLRMADILKLKLRADLVVLSACETGLGRQVTGEGMVGFSRAFFYAGARSLAVSLWLVADSSTPDLMLDFYRRLERGERKAEALRQAKLAMIAGKRFAHPFYWAPFVLVGDAG